VFITLATRQSTARVRVWRNLRGLGCATLRDGVYVLPESPQNATALEQVSADVRSVEGTAEIFLLDAREEAQRLRLVALFDRREEYAVLLSSIRAADVGDAKARRALWRDFAALSAIDFYPGEARRQAEEALTALEAQANGEPASVKGRIRRLASADFQGRTWATRKKLWVDRMASSWLIARFIDRAARFVWLADPKRCPRKALGFDFDGAAFSHVGGLVTFEVLAASFGLDTDPALARIAAIVHFLDVGGIPAPEAAGIAAVLAGACVTARNDDELLLDAGRLFDNLYAKYRLENAHD
jgi:hypothetical protein